MAKDEGSISVLRKVVVDVFLIAGLTICICVIRELWTPFSRGFFCDDESLKYPYHEDTVTVPVLRLVGLGLPILAMVICEWALLRSEPSDTRVFGVQIPTFIRGLYCALASFGLGACFVDLSVEVAKRTIGRPRPHFFDVCQPSVNCNAAEWKGRYVQAHDYNCTGDRIDLLEDMRMSFVSGHSALSAFTMLYLALYLEARMTWRGTRVLRHSLQFGAVLISWFTALSRISDYKHHWGDVLAGYSLGLILAVLVRTWGTDVVRRNKNHREVPQQDVYAITQQNA